MDVVAPPPRPVGRRPRQLFETSRRGWLAMVGVCGLLTGSMLLENAAFPQGAITPMVWLSIGIAVLACLAAYPTPFLGLLLAVALSIANMLVPGMPHGGGTELITLLFLIGFLSFRLPGRWGLAAWAVAASSVGLSAALSERGDVFEIAFYLLFLAPAWVVGMLLQRERTRSAELSALAAELAAEREQGTQNALVAERARIARELHDAVAHSVSVMTLQVGVVRRRLGALPAEQETLAQAEQLGRRSVDELRRIVGLVRTAAPELSPVVSLAQLDDLVDQVRAAGTTITLRRSGALDDVAPTLGVTVYRLVQEAVTNALKHAPGSTVSVDLAVGTTAITVGVVDDGPAPGPVVAGHGLTGMRERVAAFGGALTYGPGTAGGFAVRADLPLDPDRAGAGRPAAPEPAVAR
ncbi:sensor histidine kinase [Microlunatus flavus]|uniref:histidine kinase n=1 Tax=Microlunatus flavus TaxID=1036181 RepID=A0A1H8Z0E5_9ACTN|nr:sensor histidine kinase [Microlunatus flavus]SEP57737.1 Signal transduction histidine kinase [Microlunatus flavus]